MTTPAAVAVEGLGETARRVDRLPMSRRRLSGRIPELAVGGRLGQRGVSLASSLSSAAATTGPIRAMCWARIMW